MQIENVELRTVGRLSFDLQTLPQNVTEVARQWGVKPAFVIDGIEHFSRTQCEFLKTKLQERKQ